MGCGRGQPRKSQERFLRRNGDGADGKRWKGRTFLVVQWLRLHAANVGGTGSIPGRGTNILHATWRGKKKKKKRMEGREPYPSGQKQSGQQKERRGGVNSMSRIFISCKQFSVSGV